MQVRGAYASLTWWLVWYWEGVAGGLVAVVSHPSPACQHHAALIDPIPKVVGAAEVRGPDGGVLFETGHTALRAALQHRNQMLPLFAIRNIAKTMAT